MKRLSQASDRWMVSIAAWSVSVVLAASAGAVVTDQPTPGKVASELMIVELTAPPAAQAGKSPAAAAAATGAAAQRGRVRQAITDLENRHRAARGLAAAQAGAIIQREYGVVLNGFAAELSPETVAALRTHADVRRIVPDGSVHALLDVSVPLVRAPELWRDFDYQGELTTIAVIDTGVDYTHPDLGGCLGPGCKVVGGYDFVNGDADPLDDHGHGTHVAATAAGRGQFPGVAPGAHILAYKVLNAGGAGRFSDIIAAIERAADPDGDGDPSDHATVISMSLGGPGDENDPVSAAVDNATAAGVLSVIAAGNAGAYFTIGSPGTARTALTVGATDDVDEIAFFSSRGPTAVDFLAKPEITAPGVNICAATIPGAFPGHECRDTTHASISGTSMATPHVSGAAALLRGLFPDLAPAEIKAMLQEGAVPLGLDVATGGAGRLDVRAAADVGTILSPAPLNFGLDDGSTSTWIRSASLTVHNLDATAKTYAFSVEGLPAGVRLSVTPNPVTVSGDASVIVSVELAVDNTITADSDAPPFLHGGSLVARAGTEQRAVVVGFAKSMPPANDACASAATVDGLPFVDVMASSRATIEPTDPAIPCGCGQNGHSVWFRFRAPSTALVTADTFGSNYDTVLSVFTGECGSLVPVGSCSDDSGSLQSRVGFQAVAGTTYLIEVGSYCGTSGGQLRLTVASESVTPAPSNDTCDGATAIDTDRFVDVLDVSGATTDPSDPAAGCGCATNGHSVWYRVTAPVDSMISIVTAGSSYDTVLSVFTGGCDGLVAVTCNDDAAGTLQSDIRFEATAGTTYLIQASSYCGAPAGVLQLELQRGQLLAGQGIYVRDRAGDPIRRKIVVQSHDPSIRVPEPDDAADPRVGGALLSLANPATGETDAFHLPASGWHGLGVPAGAAGYRYTDRRHDAGPCTSAVLRAGTLRATCSGAQMRFSLDEPVQGSLRVKLTTGPEAYCMLFGGTVLQDGPAVGIASGVFKAVDAPAPASCP